MISGSEPSAQNVNFRGDATRTGGVALLRLALHGVHLTRHRAIRLHLIVALGTRRDGISHLKSERARCRTDGTNRRGTKGVSIGQFVSP